MVQMANAVKAETNGRMEIQVYPNSQLGSQASMIAQVRLGSLQFMQTGNAQFSSIVPVAAIDSLGFAFSNGNQPLEALDGNLGAYIRREFAAKGLLCFDKVFDASFRQVTSSLRPIRAVGDFAGTKIRVPSSPIYVEMFRALGASPVALDTTELYTALQTRIVDAQETPLTVIESYRLSEVQKYLSLTSHGWGGLWLVGNLEAWNALPPDIQDIVKRNEAKYALLERRDVAAQVNSLANKLAREGFAVNQADTSGMRARLGPYYARWKNEFGSTAWGLLEAVTGKLA
jgi:tripartite ATP-independent transporter DctP family solute receptor